VEGSPCWSLGFPGGSEWAYAGIFFEYTAAVFSKAVVPGYLRGIDDPGALLWTPLILAVLTLISWALRPQSRTLGVLFPALARRTKRSVNAPVEQAVSR
jgi:hypothetical protein